MTSIKIGGLAVGLAAFAAVELYIAYETGFDGFFPNSRNIYRIRHDFYKNGGLVRASAVTSPAVAAALESRFPEVDATARITRAFLEYAAFSSGEEIAFKAERTYFATPSFLTVFAFPLIRGDPETALSRPLSVVLTRSTAEKYFGELDPMGRTLVFNSRSPFTVTGVCEDVPANSHFRFDVLLSFASIPEAAERLAGAVEDPDADWSSQTFYSYIRLKPGADPDGIARSFNDWFSKTRGEDWRADGVLEEIRLQPLENIHLFSNLDQEMEPGTQGNGEAVRVLKIIAVFILVLTLVNSINLTTSRALERAHEVGVRKVTGARRPQLVRQFLCEYAGIYFAAALLGGLLLHSALPVLGRLAGAELSLGDLFRPGVLSSFLWFFLLGSVIAGVYPALLMSSFQPLSAVKSGRARIGGGARTRRWLVTLQLAVTIALVAGTLIISRQITFMLHKDPGFDVERTLVLHAPGTNSAPPEIFSRNVAGFLDRLRVRTDILSVATATSVPGEEVLWSHWYRRLEDPPDQVKNIKQVGINAGFLPAFGVRILAGRNFAGEQAGDAEAVILNRSAAALLGYDSPESAIGRKVVNRRRERPVIGVVEDYNQLSPKTPPIPQVFLFSPHRGFVLVKVRTGDWRRIIGNLEGVWRHSFPGIPFAYFFLDDFFNRHYRNDRRFGRIFALFSALTILIAGLGLFALASHNAVRRTKEIGIRKAMGASARDIYLMLCREFVKLAVFAGLLALPFTYLRMRSWLENYAFKAGMAWWPFAAAWAAVVLIVLLIVSRLSIKAALADPVDALRYE
jgi:putative ABC transport system permease protein